MSSAQGAVSDRSYIARRSATTVLKNCPGSYTDRQLRLMKNCPEAQKELIKRGLEYDPKLIAEAIVKARFHARRFRD